MDCLELFPDQLIVVVSEQLIQQNAAAADEMFRAHKKLLFDTIAKYYNSPDKPALLSGRYTDIQAGILHLIGIVHGILEHFYDYCNWNHYGLCVSDKVVAEVKIP